MMSRGCKGSALPCWHHVGILSCPSSTIQDSNCTCESNIPTSGKLSDTNSFWCSGSVNSEKLELDSANLGLSTLEFVAGRLSNPTSSINYSSRH